jgi:hypothetical protein
MRYTASRKLQPATNAMLDFLVDHPYATLNMIVDKLGFARPKVQAVYYQYGFTGSTNAKKKFYTMWLVGEEIRKKWPPKDLVAQAEGKWTAKSVAMNTATWPDEDPVNQVNRIYAELEKKQEPTKGQAVLRETITQDDAEIAKLRAEINRLNIIVDYLASQRKTV